MFFWIFFLLIPKFVKGNSFYGEKKWQPKSWEDLNKEWEDNFIKKNEVFGIGRKNVEKPQNIQEDPEVYSWNKLIFLLDHYDKDVRSNITGMVENFGDILKFFSIKVLGRYKMISRS